MRRTQKQAHNLSIRGRDLASRSPRAVEDTASPLARFRENAVASASSHYQGLSRDQSGNRSALAYTEAPAIVIHPNRKGTPLSKAFSILAVLLEEYEQLDGEEQTQAHLQSATSLLGHNILTTRPGTVIDLFRGSLEIRRGSESQTARQK